MAKKKQITDVLLWILIAVFGIAVLLGLLFAGGGPMDKLERAAQKTFFADNFTAMGELTVNDTGYHATINTAIDRNKRTLDMYMQLSSRRSDYICGIVDNTLMILDTTDSSIQTANLADRIDAFFTALEDTGAADWALLLDLEELDLYADICESFDFPKLLACVADFLNQLNDSSWAKEHAGFSKDRIDGVTVYSYRPNLYDLTQQLLPDFKNAFLKEQDYSDLEAYIDDAKFLFREGCADVYLGIKAGRLVSAEFALEYHNTSFRGSFQFIGIGSTVVDSETVAYYIDEANKN